MPHFTVREYRDEADARRQYELWLNATAGLPRAWRSNLRNVQHQLEQAQQFPGCRLYAESKSRDLLGYIGTHPPFEWDPAKHAPPSRSLGWAIPFGFPWTFPQDEEIEVALYDEMIRSIPILYADSPRDFYIQRFRESWTRPIEFLKARGWRLIERLSLMGHEVNHAGYATPDLVPITRADLSLVSALSHADETSADVYTTEDLEARYDGGWIVSDTFWRLSERGAFALEQRGPWAAVTFFQAKPDAWDETLAATASQAGRLGAKEIYFTIDTHESKRRASLEQRGFREVDAGVYYVRDAD